MQDGTTVTELYYTKLKTYSAFASKVHGPLDKFNYVNFTLSSDRDMLLMAQLNYTTTKVPTEQTDHLTGKKALRSECKSRLTRFVFRTVVIAI